jgi:hypothetical protein
MLAAMLASLAGLRLPPGYQLVVVVVDNDAAGSARPVVEAARPRMPWPLEYRQEPVRNIALARNLAIRTARGLGASLLAFADDDTRVPPHWLEAMLEGLRRHGASAVGGPVAGRLDPATPAWIVAGRFFDLKRYPTGTPLPHATSANLLARIEAFEGEQPFDPAFGLLGGSDAVLFARWRRQGLRLLAVDEGLLEETIPASRGRPAWILRRAFRVGNTGVLLEKALPRGERQLLQRLARSSLRMAFGLVSLLPSLVLGRAALLRALWSVSFGAGSWAAALGYRYEEYRVLHGE